MSGPAINSVAWFEIGTDRPEEVKQFYGQLFGWNYQLNTNWPSGRLPSWRGPMAARS